MPKRKQQARGSNTSAKRAKHARSRGWCFTLNNWTLDEESAIKSIDCKYLVFGREKGDNGTPHLQGYIYFASARSFTSITKKLPRAHVEKAEGTGAQNRDYCTKDGDYHEYGEVPLSEEDGGAIEKGRWETIKEHAVKGDLDAIEAKVYVQHYRSLKQIAVDHMTRPPDLQAPCGIWYYGESGSGKTTAARMDHGSNYYLKGPTKWWDGYQHQPVVILDDLDPFHKALGYYVKMWADKWCFPAETKGSSAFIRPKTFIITSQYLPEGIWGDLETVLAVRRRFTIIEVRDKKKCELLYTMNSTPYEPPVKVPIQHGFPPRHSQVPPPAPPPSPVSQEADDASQEDRA